MIDIEELRKTSNPAFRFVVKIGDEAIAAFTECNLPVIEWEMEEVKEGGLNTYVHMLPGRRKRATITLKNGVGLAKKMIDWYIAGMNEQFEYKNVSVDLMSAPDKKTMTWEIASCMPTKWTGPQLKSSDNTIAIQTLEMACGEIKCIVLNEVAEKTGWKPEEHTVPPDKQRVQNANNKALIPPHTVPPDKKRVQA
jgi:phage tail-like protein